MSRQFPKLFSFAKKASYLWLSHIETDIKQLHMEEHEVCALAWFTIEEIRELIITAKFMPSLIPAIENCINVLTAA